MNEGDLMTFATISPKYQVVIPREVRRQVPIRSGQKVTVVAKNGLIYIVPSFPMKKLKGQLKHVSLEGFRDKKDRI